MTVILRFSLKRIRNRMNYRSNNISLLHHVGENKNLKLFSLLSHVFKISHTYIFGFKRLCNCQKLCMVFIITKRVIHIVSILCQGILILFFPFFCLKILKHKLMTNVCLKAKHLAKNYQVAAVVAEIISGVPDTMSGRPSALCRTFWAPVRHFPQLMTGKYHCSFLFSLSEIVCVLNPAGQNVWHHKMFFFPTIPPLPELGNQSLSHFTIFSPYDLNIFSPCAYHFLTLQESFSHPIMGSVRRFFPGGGKNHGKNRKKPSWKK